MKIVTCDRGLDRLFGVLRIGLAQCWLTELYRFRSIESAPASGWRPVSLCHLLHDVPDPQFVGLLHALAIASTRLLLIGAWTRIAGVLSFASGCLLACIGMSYGSIAHSANSLHLVFAVMLFSDWGRGLSVDCLWRRWRGVPDPAQDAAPAWPLWLAVFVIALPYFSSGLLKVLGGHFLRTGNLDLFLKACIVDANFVRGEPFPAWVQAIQEWLLARPILTRLLAIGTVAFEMGFWLGLFSRRTRLAALGAAVAFHAAIGILAHIFFRIHVMVLLLLLASHAVLVLRERTSWLQRLFPLPAVYASQRDEASRPRWLGILISWVGISAFLLAVSRCHLAGASAVKGILLEWTRPLIWELPDASLVGLFVLGAFTFGSVAIWLARSTFRRRANADSVEECQRRAA